MGPLKYSPAAAMAAAAAAAAHVPMPALPAPQHSGKVCPITDYPSLPPAHMDGYLPCNAAGLPQEMEEGMKWEPSHLMNIIHNSMEGSRKSVWLHIHCPSGTTESSCYKPSIVGENSNWFHLDAKWHPAMMNPVALTLSLKGKVSDYKRENLRGASMRISSASVVMCTRSCGAPG